MKLWELQLGSAQLSLQCPNGELHMAWVALLQVSTGARHESQRHSVISCVARLAGINPSAKSAHGGERGGVGGLSMASESQRDEGGCKCSTRPVVDVARADDSSMSEKVKPLRRGRCHRNQGRSRRSLRSSDGSQLSTSSRYPTSLAKISPYAIVTGRETALNPRQFA